MRAVESQCEIKITGIHNYLLIISSILKPCFLGRGADGAGGAEGVDVKDGDDELADVEGKGFKNPGGTEGERCLRLKMCIGGGK